MSADTSLPALVPATVNEAALSELGVKYLLPSYVDLHGVSKSKMVPVDHYDRMLTGSELCTGAALDGVPQALVAAFGAAAARQGPVCREALAGYRRMFRGAHQDTLNSFNNLVVLLKHRASSMRQSRCAARRWRGN